MSHDVQQEAIAHISSPLCIVAGPGTGKTTLLTQKVISLISRGYDPNSILVLTFTQKAAEEMSSRVKEELKEDFRVKTYHSFFLELLEEENDDPKIISNEFTILDELGQLYFFMNHIKKNSLSSRYMKLSNKEIAKGFQRAISLLKEHNITPEKLTSLEFENLDYKSDLLNFYVAYEMYKKEESFIDFADIQISVRELIKNENIREKIQKKYSYVLVDEFQDTNQLQLEIIFGLAKDNITVVGDPKQSIYGFRGTTQDSLKLFSQVKNAKILYLRENFRSSKNVIESVNCLIPEFGNRKELLEAKKNSLGLVKHIVGEDEFSQKSFIVEKILSLENKNTSIGILCRTKSQVKEFSSLLKQYSIEHNAPNIDNFFSNPLVDEVVTLLNVLVKPREDNVGFFKLLESLHLHEETLLNISRKVNTYEKSYYELFTKKKPICENSSDNELLNDYFKQFKKMILLKESKFSIEEYVIRVLSEFRYYKKALIQGNLGVKQLNDFVEFVKKSSKDYKFFSLKEFVEFINVIKPIYVSQENQDSNSNIIVTTLHQSKGKEFDIVFMPHCNDRKFPKRFVKEQFPTPFDLDVQEHLAEERRLFFVGISRAKEELYLISVKEYSENKNPSKISEFLLPLKIEPTNYDKKELPVLENKSSVEEELITQLLHLITTKNYDLAKEKLEILEKLFSTTSSLKKFLGNTDELKLFEKRISQNESLVPYDFSNHFYSVSQLKNYEQCPKKYLFQNIYKIPTPSKYYFDFGTSLHSVLEHIKPEIDSGLDEKKATLRALKLLGTYWISKSYKNGNEEKDFYELAIECIKKYIKKEFAIKSDSRENVALEKKFFLNIEGKTIMGFIDRIDKDENGLIVYDYKTSSSKETKNELLEHLQLYTYALALKELEGYKNYPSKMALWYLKHDSISSVEFDENVANKIREKLLYLIKKIESKDFKATPSTFACSFCDYNTICADSKTEK